MPSLAPPNTAAGVNPEAGGADAGGPGRAIALASVAPNAIALGSCATRDSFLKYELHQAN